MIRRGSCEEFSELDHSLRGKAVLPERHDRVADRRREPRRDVVSHRPDWVIEEVLVERYIDRVRKIARPVLTVAPFRERVRALQPILVASLVRETREREQLEETAIDRRRAHANEFAPQLRDECVELASPRGHQAGESDRTISKVAAKPSSASRSSS